LFLPLAVQDTADKLCFVVVRGASMGCGPGRTEAAPPGREQGARGTNEAVNMCICQQRHMGLYGAKINGVKSCHC